MEETESIGYRKIVHKPPLSPHSDEAKKEIERLATHQVGSKNEWELHLARKTLLIERADAYLAELRQGRKRYTGQTKSIMTSFLIFLKNNDPK